MTLTIRILSTLYNFRSSTARALADGLNENEHVVRSTLTNLRRVGCVKVVGKQGKASVYEFVRMPTPVGRPKRSIRRK